jgi:hypothetical protein
MEVQSTNQLAGQQVSACPLMGAGTTNISILKNVSLLLQRGDASRQILMIPMLPSVPPQGLASGWPNLN